MLEKPDQNVPEDLYVPYNFQGCHNSLIFERIHNMFLLPRDAIQDGH